MALIRATVTLNKASGLPLDAINNVWHYTSANADSADADALVDFYQTISPSLSPSLSDGSSGIVVDLAEVTPGGAGAGDDTVTSPLVTVTDDLGTPGSLSSNSHVQEVAACLSFAGDLSGLAEESGATRPRARRRGRVYLGPLSNGATTTGVSTGDVRFTTTFLDLVLDAVEVLNAAWLANTAQWVVYSRTTGLTHDVETVWMDDAPDIVRSRGVAASLRDTRTL